MRVNLKVLSTFLAVAENESFRKAADQTHISLPAVSMQIKQLEERLGVTLLQRTTRKVLLTPEGQRLMVSTRKAMAEIDAALLSIEQAANAQQGNLIFACVPTVASTRLPALVTDFAHTYPGISVGIREKAQPEMLEAIRKREVDFGIGPLPDKAGEFECISLFEDPYVALVPDNHPLGAKNEVSLRELVKLSPSILMLGSSQLQQQLDAVLQKNRLQIARNYDFTHVSTMAAMVEAGLGVGILPKVAVPRQTSLKVVHLVRPILSRTVAVISLRGHALSTASQRFVEMCRQVLSA
jgi:DNA-binding transcriptional LysR family regulator